MDIYLYMRERRCGPYQKAQLEEMWNRGQIPKDALYWHDGMAQWAVIAELFASIGMALPLPMDAGSAESINFPAAS